MKIITLFWLFCVSMAYFTTEYGCDYGWFLSTGVNGTQLCIKTFLDRNFHTLDDASDLCASNDGFLAPMRNSQQEQAIRESLAGQSSPPNPDGSMLVYMGARRHRQNSTFYWLYDKSEVWSGILWNQVDSDGNNITADSQNCLMFEWNPKVPTSSLTLETTSCNCIVTGDCRKTIAGFVCAKYSCPLKYKMYGSMCYKNFVNCIFQLVDNVNPEISANSASEECKKIPGGNLATLGSKKLNDYFRMQSDSVVFGLRCPNTFRDMFEGKTNNCIWDDGTLYEYNNFDPKRFLPAPIDLNSSFATMFGTGMLDMKSRTFGGCVQLFLT